MFGVFYIAPQKRNYKIYEIYIVQFQNVAHISISGICLLFDN